MSLFRQSIIKFNHYNHNHLRNFCTSNEVKSYPKIMQLYHWTMALGIGGGIGLVEYHKRLPKGDPRHGTLMYYHKSLGVLMMGFILLRFGTRITNKLPGYLPGASWEHTLSSISHWGLYGFMFFMPMSGIAMGYYGGKGLPFFVTTIPGKSEPSKDDKSLAGMAYKYHKKGISYINLIYFLIYILLC